jgi:hypothetical protein
MQRRKSIAWTALCMCLSGTVADASTWQLRVFNVDDKINVFLNGAGTPILATIYLTDIFVRYSCKLDRPVRWMKCQPPYSI